jgi:hypothetical protein
MMNFDTEEETGDPTVHLIRSAPRLFVALSVGCILIGIGIFTLPLGAIAIAAGIAIIILGAYLHARSAPKNKGLATESVRIQTCGGKGAILFFLSVVIVFSMFTARPSRGVEEDAKPFPPSIDDVLHMQLTHVTGLNSSIEENYTIFLIDLKPAPSLPFFTGRTGYVFFASPPLASPFTFNSINLTLCHDTGGSPYVEIGIGKWDIAGNAHFQLNTTAPLTPYAAWTNITVEVTLTLQEGERLLLLLRTKRDASIDLWLYFGDSDHDSRAQYAGTAAYVPEFPASFTFLLLLYLTAAAKLLKKESDSKKIHNSSDLTFTLV